MNAVITEKARVDDHHGINIVDARLVPGELVEVIVRSTQKMGFLETPRAMNIDTPVDFSVQYEALLQSK